MVESQQTIENELGQQKKGARKETRRVQERGRVDRGDGDSRRNRV